MNYEKRNLLRGYNLLLYFSGSMLMNKPTEDCVTDFWTNGNLKNLPVSSSNPRFIKAASLLRESCHDDILCTNFLAEDFSKLFSVTGLRLAPALSSIYLIKAQKNDRSAENVSEFYNSYGWHSSLRDRNSDDHLGVELLFLTRLVDRYLLLDDDPCCIEMRKEIRRYIENHLLSWVPSWNNDVQEYAETSCYKGIATLIHACIEDLYGLFS
jgi:TorA maturation chaperone TorD